MLTIRVQSKHLSYTSERIKVQHQGFRILGLGQNPYSLHTLRNPNDGYWHKNPGVYDYRILDPIRLG